MEADRSDSPPPPSPPPSPPSPPPSPPPSSAQSTPTQCRSLKIHQHLSASLRERLRKSRRSFSTPSCSTPYRSTPSCSSPSFSTPSCSSPSFSTPSRSTPSFSTPSFSTPYRSTPSCSVAKRLCVDDDDEEEDEGEDERQRKRRSDGPQVAADPRDPSPKPPGDYGNVEGNGSQVQSGTAEGGGVEGGGAGDEPRSPAEVLALRDRLRRQLRDRAEVLRRLHMVKMYRSKNDLNRLQVLIDKWRGCAQAALYQLQTELPSDSRKASLAELLAHLGLDHKILHFDCVEDDFTD